MRKIYVLFNLILTLALLVSLFVGCTETGDDFSLQILVNTQRAHAPATLQFSAERSDATKLEGCFAQWDFGDGVQLSGQLEAEHRYQKAGNYKVKLQLECDKKSATTSLEIQILAPVDLAAEALSVQPRDVHTGTSLQVQYRIINFGADLELAADIAIYLAETNDWEAVRKYDNEPIYRYSLASLPGLGSPNPSKTETLSIPLSHRIKTGQYYLLIAVDPEEKVGDANRSNNVLVSNQSIMVRNQSTDGADLAALTFNVAPPKTRNLNGLTAEFSFINEGSATSTPFAYEIWVAPVNETESYEDGRLLITGEIEGATSGATQFVRNLSIPVSPSITQPGLYYFWLILDSDNDLTERNEENNTLRSAAPIQVEDQIILDADIIVNSVQFTPDTAVVGGSISATTYMENQGQQPTGSFICSFYLSQSQALQADKDLIIGTLNVHDLAPQTKSSLTTILEIPHGLKTDDYWLFAFCDSSGVVAEHNEDNNIQRSESPLAVVANADIDLLIADLTLKPNTPKIPTHESVTIAMRLCNNGSTPAGPHVVAIAQNNLCQIKRREILRHTVDGIDADDCIDVELDWTFACDFWCDKYDLEASIDATEVIDETNESNNVKKLAGGLTLSGEFCACVPDAFTPNQRQSTAKELPQGSHALTLCPHQEDWYQIDVPAGDAIELTLAHDAQRGALEISLWEGIQKKQADAGTNTLRLTLPPLAQAKSYFVQVRSLDGKGNLYNLQYTKYSNENTHDLAVGNVHIQGEALDIYSDREVNYTLYNYGSPVTQRFAVGFYRAKDRETFTEEAELLARREYDGLNAVLDDVIALKLPPQTLPGTWRLFVKIDDDEIIDDSRRENNIAQSKPWVLERHCWDAYEPNNSFESASEIALQGDGTLAWEAQDLQVCQDAPDYYRFTVPTGYALDIEAETQGNGDFDIVLYDAEGNELAASRTAQKTERIHRPLIMGNQTVVLEVHQLKNAYNTYASHYSLRLSAKSAPEWEQCNAAFEPNDFPSTAYPLIEAASAQIPAALCPASDEDYYRVYLLAGQRLKTQFNTQSAQLRATLYAPGGVFAAILTDLRVQPFDYTAPFDGEYLIKIYSNSQSIHSQDYTIVWEGLAGMDLALSDLRIAPVTLQEQGIGQAEFSLSNQGTEPIEGYRYTLNLVKNGEETLLMEETIQQTLAMGAEVRVQKKFDLPASYTGDYEICAQAYLLNGQDSYTPNNRRCQNVLIESQCRPDAYEPNDTWTHAYLLQQSSIQARICENDKDWYAYVPSSDADKRIKLSFTHSKGDLDLYIYDDAQALLAQSRTQNAPEEITLHMQAHKTYYFLVQGFPQTSTRNDYTLSIE